MTTVLSEKQMRVLVRRFHLSLAVKNKPTANDKATSALHERFTAMLESKVDSSAISSIRNNPEAAQVLEKYADGLIDFTHRYQSEISYLKLEPLLRRNRHAREIADTLISPAWSGTELVRDSNLRILIDTAPKPKKTIITPPTPIKDRIHDAKEGSLDYKLAKFAGTQPKDKEQEDYRQLYKERLLGPLMFNAASPASGIGLITTLADARINEQIDLKLGQFKEHPNMDAVRGKPLSKEQLANATDTNYYMNQILQKQECLPPWIESQRGVNGDIERLRFELDRTWALRALELIDRKYPRASTNDLVAAALREGTQLHDESYHQLKLRYLQPLVKDINMLITTYNLSSPSPNFHKWKLIPEDELQRLYARVADNLASLIKKRAATAVTSSKIQSKSTATPNEPDLGFLKAIKSIFVSFRASHKSN